MNGAARSRPGLGIRARLVLLVLGTVLPVAALAGLAAWRAADSERAAVERGVLSRAEALARGLDGEVEALSAALRTLAASPAFQESESDRVLEHMRELARLFEGGVALRDAEGRLLLHSALGAAPPQEDEAGRAGVAEALRAGAPRLSDLIPGPASDDPSYGVRVPVRDAAGGRMLLAFGFPAERLRNWLRRAVPEPGWQGVVADRTGRVVAASGPLATGEATGLPGLVPGAVARGSREDGEGRAVAAVRAASGWTVAVSLPAAVLDAPVREAVRTLLVAAFLLLGGAALLALIAAGRIARAIRRLSDAAAALGRGAPVPAVETALSEVDQVGEALARAARDLAARGRLLREREAQLARTQRLARVGGFEVTVEPGAGPGGGPLFRNLRSPEYLALHGLPPEATEEPHGAWISRLHPEDREVAEARFRETLLGGPEDYAAEYRIVTPGGETRWIAALAEVERDEAGRARRLRGVHVDVTALGRAEERLRENEAALAAAEERLRLAVEAGELVAWEVDTRSGRVVASSRHFANLGREIPPEGRTTLGEWRALVHPEDLPGLDAAIARAVEGGGPLALEYRIRRADGATRWVASLGRPLPGGARYVGVYADVTERKEAEAALRARVGEALAAAEAAQAQLAQARKLEALGQLTGGVAHDFNNLLQVVASGTALLRRRPALSADPGATRLLDGLSGAAERGRGLVQRMLAFARRQELRAGAVDTAALIRGLEDMLARSLGPRIRVETELPEGLWWTRTDPNQLELALLNLCVNARDALPPERFPEARVRIVARNRPGAPPEEDQVSISVSDEGEGMDPETLARAAEPFFTTKGVGRGTGLGLSMVHGLAAQSGGALRLDSAPGRGTTAELLLPRAAPGSEIAPLPIQSPPPPPATPCLSVLVVDDDPLVLSTTAALLADLGHASREAGSAEAALAALRAGPLPDLVLTDHAMPGMTGAALAERVAESWPRLPVVLASGYADLPRGALGLPRLDKPFDRDALARALAEACPTPERARAAG